MQGGRLSDSVITLRFDGMIYRFRFKAREIARQPSANKL